MISNVKIVENRFHTDFEWVDNIKAINNKRRQQISLEPTMASDRGNLVAAFDVVTSLDVLKPHLTNYYFCRTTAELENELPLLTSLK